MRPLMRFLFVLTLVFSIGGNVRAQKGVVVPADRSLENLRSLPDDTMKVLILNRVGWDTAYHNLALGLEYAQEALTVAKRINFLRGTIISLNTIGATYNDMGEYDEALAAHMEGLKYAEIFGDPNRTGTAYMNMSLVYSSMGDTVNARTSLERAVRIYEESGYEKGLSVAYINLGSLYLGGDFVLEAKSCFRKSQQLANNMNLPQIETQSWSALGVTYAKLNQPDSARFCMERAMIMIDSLDDDYTRAQIMSNNAAYAVITKDYTSAEKSLRACVLIFAHIGVREELVRMYRELSEVFSISAQPDSALHYYKKYMLLQDSLVNEDVLKHQRNLEARYNSEKQKQEIELLTTKGNVRQWFLVAIIGCSVVLIFLVFALYKRNRFRKATNAAIAKQNTEIEEKNRNITDSINYASRIQEAVVPSIEQLKNNFTDAFVLSRPKDIVSGDFWWCSEKNVRSDDHAARGEFFLAGADSTGHGVPGGFMSMLGSVFLFELVTEKGLRSPAEILNQLRDKVITALSRSGIAGGLKDGMDMVMCTFSPDRKKVQFACAMNPLWVIRKNAVIEYRADKFPVGEYLGETRSFTLMEHETEPGDMIYIFSDGYADQFGGPEGKKFKYRQLRDILCTVASLPCTEQERVLLEKFEAWKGQHEQVDDVLIIGIRI
jgi:serine phosphatase RsbU (regulator of sigma subunit)/tetratricopeptide (TPR) repeat protein